ncbi:hypothetical protein VTN02DRAFT_5705 [Thermoascus thermophilus]
MWDGGRSAAAALTTAVRPWLSQQGISALRVARSSTTSAVKEQYLRLELCALPHTSMSPVLSSTLLCITGPVGNFYLKLSSFRLSQARPSEAKPDDEVIRRDPRVRFAVTRDFEPIGSSGYTSITKRARHTGSRRLDLLAIRFANSLVP